MYEFRVPFTLNLCSLHLFCVGDYNLETFGSCVFLFGESESPTKWIMLVKFVAAC